MRARQAGRGRAVRVAIVGALLLDVLVLGVDSYLLATHSKTTTVDLEEALKSFHADEGQGSTTPTAAPDTTGATVATDQVDPALTSTTAGGRSPATTANAPTSPAAGPFTPPAPGVYAYRTAGRETASLLDAHHDYPAETYAVVRRTGGCGWTVHAEVVKEHVDDKEMCSAPGRLTLGSVSRLVQFFGVTDGGRFICDPPLTQHDTTEAAGATDATDCREADGRAGVHLVRTTLAPGHLTIGGVAVDVVRFRLDGTLSGVASGTSSELYSVDAATGLPVLLERHIDARSAAFGVDVIYREDVRFDLVSLTPTT